MSIDLAVTLGHNSSCIAIDSNTGEIICGFEEERLTGIKSDSSYPILSIEKCIAVANRSNIRFVYVSHWFANGILVQCKYYDKAHMKGIGARSITSISNTFTHHDAHNESAITFAQSSPGFEEDFHSLVVDGFGTMGECLSIYKSTGKSARYSKSILLHRAFGYHKSLGLLFQYATAFLGLKMQQDEYKLLGYETHCEDYDAEDFEKLQEHANSVAKRYFESVMDPFDIDKEQDPIVNTNALKQTKDEVFKTLETLIEEFDIDDRSTFESKVLVSLFVQYIIEQVIIQIVHRYNVKKLVCSGGVFMNVKLNYFLSKYVDKLCVMPLAGDQGAALGLYNHYNYNLKWPEHLAIGKRFWNNLEKFEDVDNLHVFDDLQEFTDFVENELNATGYVNAVIGDMEYGPRALCNTSTLAIPSTNNLEKINELNDRSTIMPMAPVMTEEMAETFLKPDYKKFHKSLEYMIAACELKDDVNLMNGATHQYKSNWFVGMNKTCRPQIIRSDHALHPLIEKMGHPLINTSFNYHGKPIVYNEADIVESHSKQNENGHIKTAVFTGEVK